MDDNKPSHHQAASGKRNRWFKDKFVTASDFSLEQRYMIERRRMLTRAVAGWGMVYGMDLSLHSDSTGPRLDLTPGLALDRHGRELFLPHGVSFTARELILLGELHVRAQKIRESGCQAKEGQKEEYRGIALLSAHYGERELDMVRSNRSCECGDNEYNHVQEVVQLSLAPLNPGEGLPWGIDGCGDCGCHPPYGTLGVPGYKVQQTAPHDRGPHDCLAACLANHFIAREGAALCDVNGIATALHDPVPLAVVALRINHCGHAEIDRIIDANHPRKLVKNNELLFDLVRGCDLTRVAKISWAAWHRQPYPVPLHKFIDMFTRWSTFANATGDVKAEPKSEADAQTKAELEAKADAAAKEAALAKEQAPRQVDGDASEKGNPPLSDAAPQRQAFTEWGAPLDTGFEFEFTGPVQIATLTPETVQIIVYVPDERSGWLQPWLVPINGLRPQPPHKCDPPGTTRGAVVQVSSPWVYDELNNRNTLLRWQTSRVEIHIRGDLILDARGQAVDAEALGMRPTPSGNGSPGGTFMSVFSIAPEGKGEEPR
ncbi:MAG: hypothetical protein HYZ45_08260 [Burkholderiales bacterium]|nr:hypothetical protein [Burkholderiales bacterium]